MNINKMIFTANENKYTIVDVENGKVLPSDLLKITKQLAKQIRKLTETQISTGYQVEVHSPEELKLAMMLMIKEDIKPTTMSVKYLHSVMLQHIQNRSKVQGFKFDNWTENSLRFYIDDTNVDSFGFDFVKNQSRPDLPIVELADKIKEHNISISDFDELMENNHA